MGEIDSSLSEDLTRFLTLGTAVESVAAFLTFLLADRKRAARLGDLRPLRRAAALRAGARPDSRGGKRLSEPPSAAANCSRALEDLRGCDHCGKVTDEALLACSRCKKAEYCS